MLLTGYRKQAMRCLGKSFSLVACLLKDKEEQNMLAALYPSH